MKKFLITTMLGIATTAAFGAASVRTPLIGGTATTTTPTANTARAGTLRAQTMKTTSVSTPSVTTTQSIATPVSTETTDARIALLKGIKGFNPGKIKDTTAAANELNSLNDRIEELTAQLDRAEAAQSTVLTESNLDAKIDEKLSQLGTSTGTKETYSKVEVDNLLNEIKRKLPNIDNDRGTINITDSNGTLVSVPVYWFIRTLHNNLSYRTDLYGYSGTQTDETISSWISNICNKTATDDRIGCCRRNGTATGTFAVQSLFPGYDIWHSRIEIINQKRVLRQFVITVEDDPITYVHDQICGLDQPVEECWVIIDSQEASCNGKNATSISVYTVLDKPLLIDTEL